jgi:hypothetical protein
MVLQLIRTFGCLGVLLGCFQDFSVCDCLRVYQKLHECVTRKWFVRRSSRLHIATAAARPDH